VEVAGEPEVALLATKITMVEALAEVAMAQAVVVVASRAQAATKEAKVAAAMHPVVSAEARVDPATSRAMTALAAVVAPRIPGSVTGAVALLRRLLMLLLPVEEAVVTLVGTTLSTSRKISKMVATLKAPLAISSHQPSHHQEALSSPTRLSSPTLTQILTRTCSRSSSSRTESVPSRWSSSRTRRVTPRGLASLSSPQARILSTWLVPLMGLPSVESLAASTMTAALKEVLVATAEAGIELSLLGSFLRLMHVL
jgi:hypothetical protein